jgi:hypothetical protein
LHLDGTHYFYVIFLVEPSCQQVSESAFLVRDEDTDHHGSLPLIAMVLSTFLQRYGRERVTCPAKFAQ